MNIKILIQEAIKDIEEGKKSIAIVLTKCLRIAYELKDIDKIIWFTWNNLDTRNEKILNNAKMELLKLLNDQFHDYEKEKEKYDKIIDEYFDLRNILIGGKKSFIGLSVGSIENKINQLELMIKGNKIPDNLDPEYVGFANIGKVSRDIELSDFKFQLESILNKIRNDAYSFLLKNNDYVEEDKELETTKTLKIRNKNVFIIHGHSEAKWRELSQIISGFGLNAVVLKEQPDKGQTLIEKFEYYAAQCSYAFAIFTPDDVIEKEGIRYFQARPNAIFELGWFCANIGRERVCLILQEAEKMKMFSDFEGIVQKRFKENISEVYKEIE